MAAVDLGHGAGAAQIHRNLTVAALDPSAQNAPAIIHLAMRARFQPFVHERERGHRFQGIGASGELTDSLGLMTCD